MKLIYAALICESPRILIQHRQVIKYPPSSGSSRKPMLLFILNSDELSQFRLHTQAEPWSRRLALEEDGENQ